MAVDTSIKIDGRDYLFKKGSLTFAPSTLVNLNPEIYERPEEWRANRFGDKDGNAEFFERQEKTKIDPKKLKFPLMIWGGGIHMVRTEPICSVDTDNVVSWSTVCHQ
jgi:cytochrome P450